MKYKVVIVEDEVHQQERLRGLLDKLVPEVAIAGVAPDIDSAYHLINAEKPELVFLDVMLPPYTGFDLLARFRTINFEIIFTTSFEEFAVKAFRLSAVDYLLKPVVEEELLQAVQKFIAKRGLNVASAHLDVLLSNLQNAGQHQKRIALPTFTGYVFVVVSDIVRCESDNTYTTFFLKDKRKIMISKTLKECESLLSDFAFFRVHHSNLINLDHIVEYQKGEGGVVKMIDGSSVDVSRRRKDEFLRMFRRVGSNFAR